MAVIHLFFFFFFFLFFRALRLKTIWPQFVGINKQTNIFLFYFLLCFRMRILEIPLGFQDFLQLKTRMMGNISSLAKSWDVLLLFLYPVHKIQKQTLNTTPVSILLHLHAFFQSTPNHIPSGTGENPALGIRMDEEMVFLSRAKIKPRITTLPHNWKILSKLPKTILCFHVTQTNEGPLTKLTK